MPRIRFRIGSVMIAVAAVAVVMGLLKNMSFWIEQPPSSIAVLIVVTVMTVIVARHATEKSHDETELELRSEKLCSSSNSGRALDDAEAISHQGVTVSSCKSVSSYEHAKVETSPDIIHAASSRSVIGRVLAVSVLISITLRILWLLKPMEKAVAIGIAKQHALKVYPGMNFAEYSIQAPTRSDWFEEWRVNFIHKSRDAGMLTIVRGGDCYQGRKVEISVIDIWGELPSRPKPPQ
jgi:hypothetical protein